jgi:hypothetical protein
MEMDFCVVFCANTVGGGGLPSRLPTQRRGLHYTRLAKITGENKGEGKRLLYRRKRLKLYIRYR